MTKQEWIPISTPPDKFQDVILFREDAGVFLGFYGNYAECLPDGIVDEYAEHLSEEELFEIRWFYYSLEGGGLLELDLLPTHWMNLPEEPKF